MNVGDRIATLAGPAAQSAGLIVDSVVVKAAGKRSLVSITVDLPDEAIGSAGLDAVADASRAIGAALDEAGVPEGPYVLEVGTPGTDRPLTERRHYLRARTRLVTLTLAAGGTAAGRLTEVEGDDALLLTDDGVTRVPIGTVARGRIEVELKRLADEEGVE